MAQQTIYPFGPDGQLPSGVGIINDLTTGGADKALSAQMGKVLNENIIGQATFEINSDDLEESAGNLGIGGKWMSVGKHSVIPVTPGDVIHVVFVKSSAPDNTQAYCGWLTAQYAPPYAAGDSIPYCSGESRRTAQIGVTYDLIAPADAAYFVINRVDGTAQVQTWEISGETSDPGTVWAAVNKLQRDLDGVPEDVTALLDYVGLPEPIVETEIDLSQYAIVAPSLPAGSTWASIISRARHQAIPVTPGDRLKLTFTHSSDAANIYAYWAWVTSQYVQPVVIGSDIPFVSGESSRNTATLGEPLYLEVPEDAAYLLLNRVDGVNHSQFWELYQTTATEKPKTLTERVDELSGDGAASGKVKVCTWNLEHLYEGAARSVWRAKINDFGADIFGACEYNAEFTPEDPAPETRDAIFSLYPFAGMGTNPGFTNRNALFANFPINNFEQKYFATGSARGYVVSEISIGGRVVKVAEAHLATDAEQPARTQQIAELITAFQNDSHVIIMGDFNCADIAEYAPFENAGYRMANGGYLGTLLTWNATEPQSPTDNIVCKGFAIGKIETFADATMTDHFALMAELTIIP